MGDAPEERGSLSPFTVAVGRPVRKMALSLLRDPHLPPYSPLLHLDDSPLFPAIFYHSSNCPDLNIPFSGMQNQPDPTHVGLNLNLLFKRSGAICAQMLPISVFMIGSKSVLESRTMR